MPYFVVAFDECKESVIRYGESEAAVSYPDDLGCVPISVRAVEKVKLASLPWDKNGCLRCEVE